MSAWTKEPWQKLPDTSMICWVEMPVADYRRAAACVDALSGIPNPATELARLQRIEFEYSIIAAGTLDNRLISHTELARLRACEAALRLIADAEYGTDTPKLRETARRALGK